MAISLPGRLVGSRQPEELRKAVLVLLVLAVKVALALLVSGSSDLCQSKINFAKLV